MIVSQLKARQSNEVNATIVARRKMACPVPRCRFVSEVNVEGIEYGQPAPRGPGVERRGEQANKTESSSRIKTGDVKWWSRWEIPGNCI